MKFDIYNDTDDNDTGMDSNTEDDEFDALSSDIEKICNETERQLMEQDSALVKGVLIEMSFGHSENKDQYVPSILAYTLDLITKQVDSKAIDGVIGVDNKTIISSEFHDYQAWTYKPRIIEKKNYVLAEMMMSVKTDKSAYALYENQQEYCDKYKIKVTTRRTTMEYVNKIGYLTGTYVKLASSEYYIEDINSRLGISNGIVDIKKEYTYEKGKRSKVLMVYVISSQVKQVLDGMSKMKTTRYKFVSYKHTTSEERLASMHYNDMKNIKAKYESLNNAMLKERIMVESRRQELLETVIMKAQHNGQNLFLAAEQGSGSFADSVTVVVNPKMTNRAKQWIAVDYLQLSFREEKTRTTSVDPEQFKVDTEYNQELIEFLRPTLQTKEAKKNRIYGKSMKSYAQALGIQQKQNQNEQNEETVNESKESRKKEAKKIAENDSTGPLIETINVLKKQILQLTELVKTLTETVVPNEDKQTEILEMMEKINNPEPTTLQESAQKIRKDNLEKKQHRNKEMNKRKEKNTQVTETYPFNDDDKSIGWCSSVNKWSEEDENPKRLRTK